MMDVLIFVALLILVLVLAMCYVGSPVSIEAPRSFASVSGLINDPHELTFGGRPGKRGRMREAHCINTMHVVVDEQNLVHGFKFPAQIMANFGQFMLEKYRAKGYKKVVMHIVTKVQGAAETYKGLVRTRSGSARPDVQYRLYISEGKKNPPGPHYMRGHDDFLALVVAADLTRGRHDVVLSSNDRYQDAAKFIKIEPFNAIYNKRRIKLNPAEFAPDLTLFQKINADRLRKKDTNKFLASQVAKYGWV